MSQCQLDGADYPRHLHGRRLVDCIHEKCLSTILNSVVKVTETPSRCNITVVAA